MYDMRGKSASHEEIISDIQNPFDSVVENTFISSVVLLRENISFKSKYFKANLAVQNMLRCFLVVKLILMVSEGEWTGLN